MHLPKLMIFDVDGTLVDFEGRACTRSRRALERVRSAGIPIAIATGRPIAIADFTLNQVGSADWVIGGNGAALLEVATGAFHRAATLPHTMAETLVATVRAALPGAGFAMDTLHAIVEEPGFARRLPPSKPNYPVADVLDGIRGHEHRVQRVIVYRDDYDDRLHELAAIVESVIDDRCEVQYGSVLPFVEVVNAGEHKAVALQSLIDHLEIPAADVWAFGDGTNDVEMLQWAGTGVAMGSARAEVQAAADAVTAPVEDGGVANYLEPLLDAAGL